jgi:1-deoxy-D-xylulose-5-phosphate synthase
MKPVVAIYSTFLQRGFDQILHDVCLQKLPVVFALDRAGIAGDDGKTHQGIFDLSYLGAAPNLILSAPKDENELQHLLYTALASRRPMAIRYPRGSGTGASIDADFKTIPIAQGEILRQGADIGILAIGSTVEPAISAARELASSGIEATIANMRYIKPLDVDLIRQIASEVPFLLTIEENVLEGGFGARISELLHHADLSPKLHCLGIPDEFVEHGPQSALRAKYELDSQGIIRRILTVFPELNINRFTATKTK